MALAACGDVYGDPNGGGGSSLGCTCLLDSDCVDSGCATGGLCDDAQPSQCVDASDCGCGAECVTISEQMRLCRHRCIIDSDCPGQSLCQSVETALAETISVCHPF